MDDAAWKSIITKALATTTAVTLSANTYTTKTIVGATIADTTTTTTVTTTTKTTKYVAMSEVSGVLEFSSDKSSCLNMQDLAATKLAEMFKTESKAPAEAMVTVTMDCTTVT